MKAVTTEVMTKIRDVIQKTDHPSWIGSVPHNYGSASAGSIKAAKMRWLFTIYIPVALILLWGLPAKHPPAACQTLTKILTNTMHLVVAVLLICKRSVTPWIAQQIRFALTSYVNGIADGSLYPGYSPTGNHHLTFHIVKLLQLFGPIHGWWCFPFERLIGMLRQIPHNHKIGLWKGLTLVQLHVNAWI